MSDFTHDDDLFSMVSDDTIDTLDTAAGGDTAAPLWETETATDGAYPNPDGSFGDPNYDPFTADSDGDGLVDGIDLTPDGVEPGGYYTDPYASDTDGDGIPDAADQTPYGPNTQPYDPYADPAGDPGTPPGMDPLTPNDPYADPYGSYDPSTDPYADPNAPSDPYADPAGYDPNGFDGQAYAPWGATFDENGEMTYVPADWTPDQFDGVGDPLGDAQYWQEQTSPTSCAVVTQGMILEKLTGLPMDEQTLMDQAEQAGIYDPENGTRMDDIGKLLEMNGVDTDTVENADMQQMVDALANGDQVIVGLDAKEIWTPLHDASTDAPLEQDPPMGHAVWVTGIDQQPDGSFVVLLNDPGAPFGEIEAVPLEDFVNAWEDNGASMTLAHPVAA